jgi:hypothetical protein
VNLEDHALISLCAQANNFLLAAGESGEGVWFACYYAWGQGPQILREAVPTRDHVFA